MLLGSNARAPMVAHAQAQNLGSKIYGVWHLVVTTGEPNDGVLCVDCDSRRAVGPIRTIRGVF